MSDNEPSNAKRAKLMDSTHSYRWEVTKEEFENCDFPDYFKSATFTIDINGEESEWNLLMYPKGKEDEERNEVSVTLAQQSENEIYKVSYDYAIETQDGYWPQDFTSSRDSYNDWHYFGHTNEEEDDNDVSKGWRKFFCSTEQFNKSFVENKLTLVATLVIHLDDDKYRNHMRAIGEFVDNMRSISSQENLTDFTIISGDKRFPCHRVILAVRSEYFEALFRNEPTKTELEVADAPELVETMLEFMSKGRIPKDIDCIAMDLILMADMYGLDVLTMACETSLINNLSPDNAVETLIAIDKVKHVSKQANRLKVLAYINKEANQVVKSKDWKKFVQNYPDLITEAFLLKCSKCHGKLE